NRAGRLDGLMHDLFGPSVGTGLGLRLSPLLLSPVSRRASLLGSVLSLSGLSRVLPRRESGRRRRLSVSGLRLLRPARLLLRRSSRLRRSGWSVGLLRLVGQLTQFRLQAVRR